MTTTKTSDIEATVAQINSLAGIGCDIIRVAVPDMASADAIGKIKEQITIPLVADIHFDYRLALRAIDTGADKIRINPGNIGVRASDGGTSDGGASDGGSDKVKAIADACNKKKIPIRIGVNSGSLENELLLKYGGVTPEAMFESVMKNVALLNRYDFDNIWLSAKASSVPLTVKTYRLLHEQTHYPLHLGITEAGTEYNGIIKSSIGIGALLLDGIGDTIRVSLTAQPEREVEAAKAILRALGLRSGIDIISCPTCARCNFDVISIANEVEGRLDELSGAAGAAGSDGESGADAVNLTIAIMGCAVNGPGEAKQADFGIAGISAGKSGVSEGAVFAKGEIIKKVPMDRLVDELFAVISK